MRGLGRRLTMSLAAVVATIGLVAASVPAAQAYDSSWGCGGACKTQP